MSLCKRDARDSRRLTFSGELGDGQSVSCPSLRGVEGEDIGKDILRVRVGFLRERDSAQERPTTAELAHLHQPEPRLNRSYAILLLSL